MKILAVPDTHAIAVDHHAWRYMINYAKEWKPDCIVQLGDFCDLHWLSKHPKNAKAACLAKEIKVARKLRQQLDDLGAAKKYALYGNHDARFEYTLGSDASAFEGLFDLDSLVGWTENNWKVVPYGDELRIGKISFVHDTGFAGKQATAQTLQFMNTNVVHGHTHRAQQIYTGNGRGEQHMAMCPGWLGRHDAPEMSYEKSVVKRRSWTQGFGKITMQKGGNFEAHIIPIPRWK